MSVTEGGSSENLEQGLGHGRPLPPVRHPPCSARQGGPPGAEPGTSAQGTDGPALTVVSGPHCSVCPGSSFSCEHSRVVRALRPQAPGSGLPIRSPDLSGALRAQLPVDGGDAFQAAPAADARGEGVGDDARGHLRGSEQARGEAVSAAAL